MRARPCRRTREVPGAAVMRLGRQPADRSEPKGLDLFDLRQGLNLRQQVR